MMTSNNQKPWKGRFSEATEPFVEQFSASVEYDQRLYPYDIQGSIAHAEMLAKVGLLTQAEFTTIREGFEAIQQEIESGKFLWKETLEDVHMNIETRLVEKIGLVGKKLHTARSRNDQVATDLKLFLRAAIQQALQQLGELQKSLLDVAEREADTIMPGFTHMQLAQPIILGHHLMAWFEMFERDKGRLLDCQKRLNECPLGSGALAGSSLPIDRHFTAKKLGFMGPTRNSLDSVSDRDFVIEFMNAAAVMMMHFSRLSEELILWASPLFGFVDLPDRFCTGSSLMPQKKNPDVCEIVRGKTGRVYGHLFSLLTLMKAQPLAYNRDNQEDKEALFDTVDTVQACLQAYTKMLPHLQFDRLRMRAIAEQGFSTATDLAEYLVEKGVPFRQAHEIVGAIVVDCIRAKKTLTELSLVEFKHYESVIEKEVYARLSVEGSIASRNHVGGTAPEQVKKAIVNARKILYHFSA